MRNTICTTLSVVLLLVAFIFLVLATVSAPVASSLKLAVTSDYTYGLLGLCEGSSCTSATYPFSFGDYDTTKDWLLSSSSRNTLAKTFIIAPIAAGLAFVTIVVTVISLFLDIALIKIISLVMTVVTFIASALIAVMVILTFHPYVAWTGWILVAGAACALIALPLLLLSITARDTSDTESTSESVREQKFGDLTQLDGPGGFNVTSFDSVPKNPYNYTSETSSSVKDFHYRGTSAKNYGPADPNDLSNSSLLNSDPSSADDVTRSQPTPPVTANGTKQNMYNGLNLQSGPSTPISVKRQMAPNYHPSVGTAASTESSAEGAPYPPNDRASTIYNSMNYGVFDHHPHVEGHQPFTELGDNDDARDKRSSSSDAQLESDEESDFTSVSQRPPNVMYSAPQGQQYPQQPMYQHQQQMPVPMPMPMPMQMPMPMNQHPAPMAQGNFAPRQQFQYQSPSMYQQNPQAPQPQYQRVQPQYQRPQNRPTVSDSILNNNPDFTFGMNHKRKQIGGRPGFQVPRAGAAAGGYPQRQGARDSPYNF